MLSLAGTSCVVTGVSRGPGRVALTLAAQGTGRRRVVSGGHDRCPMRVDRDR